MLRDAILRPMSRTLYVLLRSGMSLCIVALVMLHASDRLTIPLLTQLEQIAYDARLRWTLPGGVDTRIVIVDIDEASLQREGQWPWQRQRLAQLVDTLFDHYHVRLLGFDMVFAEPQSTTQLRAMDQLAQGALRENADFQREWAHLRPQWDGDKLLAASFKDRAVVNGYYFSMDVQQGSGLRVGQLPPPVAAQSALAGLVNPFGNASGYNANVQSLQLASGAAGFFNSSLMDADGLFRRVPLLLGFEGQLYEHLSLAMVRRLLDNPPLELYSAGGYAGDAAGSQRIEGLRVGAFDIPIDAQGATWVPYRGAQGSFPYISAAKVLSREADPQLLKGAIVLVGATAAGLMDLRSTPLQNTYPGVEINANLVAGMLDQTIKYRPPYTGGLELAVLALLGLLSTGLGWLPPLRALLAAVTVAGIVVGFNLYAWQTLNQVIPLAPSLALLLLLYLLHSSYGYFVNTRREHRLAHQFGHYVPRELVAEMSRRPDSFALGGESREMTVLFSDLQDFTTLSEALTPQQLTQLMQFVLTPLTRIIHEQRGTVDKYIGDAIMAFWGAPLTDADHARHAVQAALAMKANLAAIEPELHAHGWPTLRIRIGINTGLMNVGNMGSEFRMAYTVLGDAVNLASRLEGAAKQYQACIVISESTRAAVPDIVCRELDRVRVKGRAQPVTLFEPLCISSDSSADLLQELTGHTEALVAYRAGDWPMAQTRFGDLAARHPAEPLYKLYLSRIAMLCDRPPDPQWDGVFNLTEK